MGKQINPAESGDSGTIPSDLIILWASFLLLHLGGPDTITSYSINDNELWWRLLLGLVIQVAAAVYAFWQSPPNPVLWIPTILVCIAGVIKFVERVQALRSGSRDNIKEKIISETNPVNDIKKVDLSSMSESRSESKSRRQCLAIWDGYVWFDIFKRLLVDVSFSPDLLMQSQDCFSDFGTREAINLITIELSFLYDILHTKAIHKHCTLGCVLHCSSLVSIIAALVVFHHLDMQKYASKDIIITYILFGAGLALEIIATFLLVSSDWTVVSLRKTEWGKCIARFITAAVEEITFGKGKSRWSRTIGQYNLIGLCLRDRDTKCAWIMRKLKIKDIWDNMYETRSIPLSGLLQECMVTELKRRAQNVHISRFLLNARLYRGSSTLERHQLQTLGWSMKKEFDECIILWHLATDICYYNETSNEPEENTERDVSWKTSNYMVYLLTQQQSMMQVGYGKKRFKATCAVIKKKFKGKGKLDGKKARKLLENKIITEVGTCDVEDPPVPDDGRHPGWRCWGRRKGEVGKRNNDKIMGELILKAGLILADELQKIEPELKRWRVINEIWMEMLGYAAIQCDSYQHAKTLSRGGELLTHVWLLTSQLGIVEQYKMRQFGI